MGLKNLYVNNLGNILLRHNFLGVFSCDLFPMKVSTTLRTSFIINLSNSDEVGTHFVSIYITKDKLEYFDSYGLPPLSPRIKKFIKKYRFKRTFIFNKKVIQNMNSYHCGYYCIAFLLSKDLNIPMNRFAEIFSNLNYNDEIATTFILEVIKKI